jgi:hypothetical protein
MKKILLLFVALVASLSINAQWKGDTVKYVPITLADPVTPGVKVDSIKFIKLTPYPSTLNWSEVDFVLEGAFPGFSPLLHIDDVVGGAYGHYIAVEATFDMGSGYLIAKRNVTVPPVDLDTLQYVHIYTVPLNTDIPSFTIKNGNQTENWGSVLYGVSGNMNKIKLNPLSDVSSINIDSVFVYHQRSFGNDSLVSKGTSLDQEFGLKPGVYNLFVRFSNKVGKDQRGESSPMKVVILEGSTCDVTPYLTQIANLTAERNTLQAQLRTANSTIRNLERQLDRLQDLYDLVKDKETLIEVKISNAVPNDFIQGLVITGGYRKINISGVESVKASDLQIYSVTGAKIYHDMINKSVVIDNLKPGIYLVKIGDLTKKVIVQ